MRFLPAAILLGVSLVGCRPASTGPLEVGDPAPSFSLPAVGGGQVALADYAGVSPVLLFFHMAVG